MIAVALTIHAMRSDTLIELQTLIYPIVSAGLLSLFLLGFFTRRVDSNAALIATAFTVLLVGAWVYLTTEAAAERFPRLTSQHPNKFWIGVFFHIFLIVVGYMLSFVLPRGSARKLENLTIWTKASNE